MPCDLKTLDVLVEKLKKQIEKPNENECVEWKWGKVTRLINDKNIYVVNNLDINICPNSNNYFKV